ncbi:leucine-rich repeat and transmembrane domain-containing protein 2-like [Mytilus trossulus]|uniref:leucine-rich repeat and transmembrane domain-containing protein 2-like n=1 Tax=Mytilus trossulus TaxID=6551 RepID=UPI003003C339
MNIFDNRKMNRLTAFIFHNLTEVYVIDLKECVIETIEENAFFNITGPLVLSLQNNKIREIHNKAFRDLTGVEIINLDDNFLQTIKSETFVNMPKLNVLTIRRNRIFHIEVNAFGELPELLILSLLSNTLICDCRIRSFRLWVLQQTSTNVDGAVCSEKDGQLIKDISNVEECKETTTEIESSINTSESAETPQPILITKTNNNVDQASNNTSILLEIIACTVSAMAFITIIIYIVIKSRCRG